MAIVKIGEFSLIGKDTQSKEARIVLSFSTVLVSFAKCIIAGVENCQAHQAQCERIAGNKMLFIYGMLFLMYRLSVCE